MNDLLLLIAVAVPCWYVYQRSVSHGLVQIDHVGTFTFGFLFYWITPLFVRVYVAKLDFPLAATWSALFREKLITPYALSCISLYLCFALGDSLGLRLFHANPARKASPVPKLALSLATLANAFYCCTRPLCFAPPCRGRPRPQTWPQRPPGGRSPLA